jgi:hypothetical protein
MNFGRWRIASEHLDKIVRGNPNSFNNALVENRMIQAEQLKVAKNAPEGKKQEKIP